jgi:ferritin-like protein
MKEKYTKEELINQLIDELEDELEGIIEYDKLYESMKAHKMHDEAVVIEKIAEEEYTHACAIWDMLEDWEVDLSEHEKIHSHWECVKKIFDI